MKESKGRFITNLAIKAICLCVMLCMLSTRVVYAEEGNEPNESSVEQVITSLDYQISNILLINNYYELKKNLQVFEEQFYTIKVTVNNEALSECIESKINLAKEREKVLESMELEFLAKAIYGEAGGCDEMEKYMVGTVIMNRVEHPSFPNEIRPVLQQGYSCYQNKRWRNDCPSQEEYNIAYDILINGVRVWEDPNIVFQAKFKQGKIVCKSRWHIYGKL